MRYFHGTIFQGCASSEDQFFPMDSYIVKHGEHNSFPKWVEKRKKAFREGKRPSHCHLQNLYLVYLVEEALGNLSCSQQPAHSRSEAEAKHNEELEAKWAQDLEDVVRDVAAALLGREIVIGDKCKYPPTPENLTGLDLEKVTQQFFVEDYEYAEG